MFEEFSGDEPEASGPAAGADLPAVADVPAGAHVAGAADLVVLADLAAAADLFAAAGIDLVGVDLGLLQPQLPGVPPLAWLDPGRPDLGDDALIELGLVACRLEGWAGAVKARAALALTRSYQQASSVDDPDLAASVAATEAGCASAHSLQQVQRWTGLAEWLERVPSAHTDFASGRLGWARAAAFQDCAVHYGDELADAVYRAERDRMLCRTSSQMRVRWNRALAKADPDVMSERAERAIAARGVQVMMRGQDPGMASLVLTGAAPLILAAKARLDCVADMVRAGAPNDPRTLDAIRLDAALDLLLHGSLWGPERLDRARPGGSRGWEDLDGPPRPPRGPVRPRGQVVVTVPLSVLTGASQQPAVLAGYGPIPAQLAREVAADAVWRCAVVDDDPASPTHQALLALGRTTYTPNYVPGRQARRFIAARDGTCRFPGCQAQAATGDLDHRLPYARGGLTCDCNLQSLCRRHHRLKHEGGIFARPSDTTSGAAGIGTGTGAGGHTDGITWSMPSGRAYTTEPEPPPF